MRFRLKWLICAAALMASTAGISSAQIIPSRESNITDLTRGQIERDRATQAERERQYQSGSTLTGEQLSSSPLSQPVSRAGKQNPIFLMPPRRPLSALLSDYDLPVEFDALPTAPPTNQK
jgi:hypothetical protein